MDDETEDSCVGDGEEKGHGGRIGLACIAGSRGVSVLLYKLRVLSIFCFPATASFINGIILIT